MPRGSKTKFAHSARRLRHRQPNALPAGEAVRRCTSASRCFTCPCCSRPSPSRRLSASTPPAPVPHPTATGGRRIQTMSQPSLRCAPRRRAVSWAGQTHTITAWARGNIAPLQAVISRVMRWRRRGSISCAIYDSVTNNHWGPADLERLFGGGGSAPIPRIASRLRGTRRRPRFERTSRALCRREHRVGHASYGDWPAAALHFQSLAPGLSGTLPTQLGHWDRSIKFMCR